MSFSNTILTMVFLTMVSVPQIAEADRPNAIYGYKISNLSGMRTCMNLAAEAMRSVGLSFEVDGVTTYARTAIYGVDVQVDIWCASPLRDTVQAFTIVIITDSSSEIVWQTAKIMFDRLNRTIDRL